MLINVHKVYDTFFLVSTSDFYCYISVKNNDRLLLTGIHRNDFTQTTFCCFSAFLFHRVLCFKMRKYFKISWFCIYYQLFFSQWQKIKAVYVTGTSRNRIRQNESFIVKNYRRWAFSHPSGKIFNAINY